MCIFVIQNIRILRNYPPHISKLFLNTCRTRAFFFQMQQIRGPECPEFFTATDFSPSEICFKILKYLLFASKGCSYCKWRGLRILGNDLMSVYARPCCLRLLLKSAHFLGYDVSLYLYMSTEQILDLIINYAYTRKKEIEKHRVLLGTQQSNPSRQIDDAKIMEIDSWIKFLIDVKNGKLDLSKTVED